MSPAVCCVGGGRPSVIGGGGRWRTTRALAVSAGLALVASHASGQQVTATWNGAFGNWSTAGSWSSSPFMPSNGNQPGVTYAVIVPVSNIQLTLDTSVTVDKVEHRNGGLIIGTGRSLTMVDRLDVLNTAFITNSGSISASAASMAGVLNNTGSLSFGTLDLTGTLNHTSGTYAGGVVNISGQGWVRGGGLFTGTTFNIAPGSRARAIDLSPSGSGGLTGVTINGNTTLVGSGIRGGLTLNGTMSGATLSDMVFFEGPQTVSGTGVFSLHGTAGNQPQFTINNDTGALTLAPTITINGGWATITGSGAARAMNNQGLLRADTSGATFRLQDVALTNSGTITVDPGATFRLSGGSFTNSGTINLGTNSRLSLDLDTGPLGGTLNLGAGKVDVLRGLNLGGGAFDLSPTSGTWYLGGENSQSNPQAVLSNGSVTTSGGALLRARTSSMNGITFDGNLSVIAGTLSTTASTLDGSISVAAGGALKMNGGSLSGAVGVTTGTLEMSGAWTTDAALTLSNSNVLFQGSYSFGPGFSMNRTGGTVELRGVLDNVGRALELNQSTGSWIGTQLEIAGGTVRTTDNQSFIGLKRLTDVEIDGTLALSAGNTDIIGGLTGGTIQLGGQGAGLWFMDDVTFTDTTVRAVASSGTNSIAAAAEQKTITIAPGSSIRGGDLAIVFGQSGSHPWANTLANQGVISADLAGQEISIQGTTFVNTGLVEARSGGTLRFIDLQDATGDLLVTGAGSRMIVDGSASPSAPSFVLDGTTSVTNGGLLRLEGRDHWSNTGTIALESGGRLEPYGFFTTAELGSVSSSDGTGVVRVMGRMDNTGNTLDVDAAGYGLEIGWSITGGTIQSFNKPVMALPGSGMELNSVTLNGDVLLNGSSLTANGSTLNGETTVGAGGTLTLRGNWANGGQIDVAGTADLGGVFSAASFAGISRAPTGQVNLIGELDLSGQAFSFTSAGVLTSIGSGGALTVDSVDLSQGFTLPMTGNATVRTAAVTGPGSITGGGFSPKAGGSLTLDAGITLTGTLLGRTPALDPGLITSHATMVGGSVFGGQFVNEGLLDAPAGHFLDLGYSSGTATETQWSNNGTVRVSGGTLTLGGSFTTAALETIDYVSGTLALTGEINNTGDSITFGPSGWTNLNVQTVNGTAGRIRGGVVNVDAGADVPANLRFDSVTINGNITGNHHYRGGIALNGTHSNGEAFIRHNTTLESGQYTNVTMYLQGKDLDLEIGAGTTMLSTSSGRSIWGEQDHNDPGMLTLVNRGLIRAQGAGAFWYLDVRDSFENHGTLEAVSGGRLILQSAATKPFENTGTISVTGGSIMELQGEHTRTGLGNYTLTNSTFRMLAGNLNMEQGTFGLAPGNTYEFQSGFVFQNGTLQRQGGTLASLGGIFVNTHFDGDFLLDDGATFMGVTANGTLTIPQERQLIIPFSQTFDSGTIVLEGGSNFISQAAEIQLTASWSTPNEFTIGEDATIRGRTARIGRHNGGFSPNDPLTLVNNGTISSDQPGKRFDIVVPMVVNNGLMEARNGATLRIGIPGTETLRFVNNGTILARDASRIELAGLMNGSVFNAIDAQNSTISIANFTALDNAGNTMTLQAGLGNTYELGHTTIRGGTLNIQPGANVIVGTSGSQGPLFDHVQVNGALSTRDLRIAGGLTGQMDLNVTGVLAMQDGDQSIGAGNTIVLGTSSNVGTLRGPLDATLTIENGATIRGGSALILTGPEPSGGTRTVVNKGLISADVNATTITIRSYRFQNLGLVQAINGGSIVYVPPLDDPVAATNDGHLRIDGSSQVVATDLFELSPTSVLEFVLNPRGLATGYAQLIAPNLNFGGSMVVSLDPSLQPAENDVFNLMDMWHSEGRFDSIHLAPLAGGLRWDVSDLYVGGSLRVVPAPGVAPMIVLALGLAARRRSRK